MATANRCKSSSQRGPPPPRNRRVWSLHGSARFRLAEPQPAEPEQACHIGRVPLLSTVNLYYVVRGMSRRCPSPRRAPDVARSVPFCEVSARLRRPARRPGPLQHPTKSKHISNTSCRSTSTRISGPTAPHAPRLGIRGRNRPTVSHAHTPPDAASPRGRGRRDLPDADRRAVVLHVGTRFTILDSRV